jgi:hypothetical protein
MTAVARIEVSIGVGEGRTGVADGRGVALGPDEGDGDARGPINAPPNSNTSAAMSTTPIATPETNERFMGAP